MLSPQHTAGKGIGEEPMPAAQAVSSEGTSKAPRAQGQGAAGGHEPPPPHPTVTISASLSNPHRVVPC